MGRYAKKYKSYYDSVEHKQWRHAVMLRDMYLCQHCKRKRLIRVAVEAHHIKPIETHWGLRLDIDNGVALCRQCHNEVHDRTSAIEQFMRSWE